MNALPQKPPDNWPFPTFNGIPITRPKRPRRTKSTKRIAPIKPAYPSNEDALL